MIKLKPKKHVLSLITYTKLNSMNLKLIRFFLLCVLALICAQLSAQKPEKDEYQGEIGVMGGGNFYIGETNSQLFNYTRVAYGGFFRYKTNPRLALRADLTRVTVAGAGNVNNPVNIGDICGEFNFFDLEKNPYKRYSKAFSPFIFAGASILTDVYQSQTTPELGLVFGVGVKLKLKNRWNLNAQWSNRLLLTDKLEGYNDLYNNPFKLNGSNIFNNDFLSTFTVGVSYDIWKKPCDCLKSN
jgi:hypothetical protein